MKKYVKLIMEKVLWIICKPSYVVTGFTSKSNSDNDVVEEWVHTKMGRFYLRNLAKIGRL